MTDMYRVTRGKSIIGSIRKSDLANHGDLLVRAKYELAQMVGGNLARSILRGEASLYSDGSMSVGPCDARGNRSIDAKSNIITYWFIPYQLAATLERSTTQQ